MNLTERMVVFVQHAACVTGADRGLGLAFVHELLQRRSVVFAGLLSGITPELQQLKQQHSEQLHLVDLDLSSLESVKKAARKISGLTEHIDLLINNGAILGDIESGLFDDLDFEEMQKVFNVNALGALRVTHELAGLVLKSSRKLIVNISSEAGSNQDCRRKSWFAYCMSKAALNMQSNLVHNQLKEMGGQVMVIHPGHVRTHMRGHLDETGRLTPAESARSILALVDQHNSYKGDKPAYLDYLGRPLRW